MDLFSERLKQLKEEKGVTYPALAEYLNRKTRIVQRYAAGTSKPDYYGLIALADFFDVSIDYLVGRSDQR